jgi:ketosteroid isomerase-like protein
MRGALTAIACLALLGALAGCGESDQEQAREVVQDFVDARNAGDGAAECALYSESYVQSLGVSDNCAAFVEEQSSGAAVEELEIVEVTVKGDTATADLDVTVEGEGEGPARIGLQLEREGGDDGDWRITAFQ